MGISKPTPAQDVIAHAQLAMGAATKNACLAHYPCTTYNLRISAYLNPLACRTNSQMMHLQPVLIATLHVYPAQDHFQQTAQPVETTYN